jgi:hypothetical protein
MLKYVFLILSVAMVSSCGQTSQSVNVPKAVNELPVKEAVSTMPDTSRRAILEYLKQKDSTGKPRIIRILVPLCDNENQGIAPVNERLGDGQNPNTNLYWGAGYGVRTFFQKSKDWELVSISEGPKRSILQQLVFKHATRNAYLIAQAYAGDQMEDCLIDYWAELSGKDTAHGVKIDSYNGPLKADLIIFNGHNGLMDMTVQPEPNTDGRRKDAIAIACASRSYFTPYLEKAGGYPLIMTTDLMAPEAYVCHAAIDGWLKNKSPNEIKKMCGVAYDKYQNCGLYGATSLFTFGWE